DNVVWDVHTGHFRAHVFHRPQRFDRPNSSQDGAAFVETKITPLPHPFGEDLQIVDELRLAETRARRDLLAKPLSAPLEWRSERILDGSNKPVRRRLQLATRE